MAAKTGDELLQAVYDAPSDDGRRLVYADWLVEQGDPRGEFIQLQFARARGTQTRTALLREKELFGAHWRAWLGDLVRYVGREGLAFERGFLDRAVLVKSSGGSVSFSPQRREWSTCREVDVGAHGQHPDDLADILRSPMLRSLTAIIGLVGSSVPVLAASPLASRIATVGIRTRGGSWDPEPLAALRGLTALRRIVLQTITVEAAISWALASLQPDWSISLEYAGLELTRAARELTAVLALPRDIRYTLRALAALPPGALARVRLVGRKSVTLEEHDALTRELARATREGATRRARIAAAARRRRRSS